jgi:3-phenylpropionate/trans-cinnamate dioxygenase ferredoxin subunit
MEEFTEAAKTGELADGTMKKVSAGGQEFLLAMVGGRYYCVQARCPHMGGDLSKGVLNGTVIECPLHHSQFDLSDGHVVRWAGGILGKLKSPAPLKTREVRVDGDRVMVKA